MSCGILSRYYGRNERENFLHYVIEGLMANVSNEDRQRRLRQVQGKDPR